MEIAHIECVTIKGSHIFLAIEIRLPVHSERQKRLLVVFHHNGSICDKTGRIIKSGYHEVTQESKRRNLMTPAVLGLCYKYFSVCSPNSQTAVQNEASISVGSQVRKHPFRFVDGTELLIKRLLLLNQIFFRDYNTFLGLAFFGLDRGFRSLPQQFLPLGVLYQILGRTFVSIVRGCCVHGIGRFSGILPITATVDRTVMLPRRIGYAEHIPVGLE